MKRLLLACLAVTVATPAASAAPGRCFRQPDPAGDVGMFEPVGALDLLRVDIVPTTKEVRATFTLAGAPDPAPGSNYEYSVVITDKSYEYRLNAGLDGGAHLPITGVFEVFTSPLSGPRNDAAEVETSSRVTVSGRVDLDRRQVTVIAPTHVLGKTARDRTKTWLVQASDVGAGVGGTKYGGIDATHATGARLVTGDGRCARR